MRERKRETWVFIFFWRLWVLRFTREADVLEERVLYFAGKLNYV
jgi:hypothetical protein